MTVNEKERIARWLGWKWRGGRIRRDLYPAQGFKRLLFDPRPFDQSLHYCDAWQPDVDITLWHGKDGLAQAIYERQLWEPFVNALAENQGLDGLWGGDRDRRQAFKTLAFWIALCATPAQLTAALVAVIEEGE